MLCSADAIYQQGALIVIANIISVLIGLIMYVLANILSNDRLKVTAIMTFVSIISTFILVIVVVLILNLTCAIKVDLLLQTLETGPLSLNPSQKTPIELSSLLPEHNNIYNFSIFYLSWVKLVVHKEITDTRNALRDAILLSSINKWKCGERGLAAVLCLVGGIGLNQRPNAGISVEIRLLEIKLYSLVTGIFTTLTQMKFLLFIQHGFLDFLLPLGIIIRSLPGTRVMGSAIIAFLLVVYVLYPLILSISGMLWFPIVNQLGVTYHPNNYLPLTTCISSIDNFIIPSDNPIRNQRMIYLTFLSLATTIFMPILHAIILIASVKHLGRLIDVDIFTGRFFDFI
ncbi:MAG: hypothetical protein N3E37_00895 [Candidatus Micrarchaeota archaeon]|nr:hypothetical protein [Candidatus Micrarchaeota archaeon]